VKTNTSIVVIWLALGILLSTGLHLNTRNVQADFPDPVFRPTLQYFLENPQRFESNILIELSGYIYPDGEDGLNNRCQLYPQPNPSDKDQYLLIAIPKKMLEGKALGCGKFYGVKGRFKKEGNKFIAYIENFKLGGLDHGK